MAEAMEGADLRAGLDEGGAIVGALIVARAENCFVVYMRPSWVRGRGFRIVKTWRGSQGDRTFKSLDSAWRYVRRFKFSGRITVYPRHDPELRSVVGVCPTDIGDEDP